MTNDNDNNNGAQLSQHQINFLNAAKLVIENIQDAWVQGFCQSLVEQVSSGKNLSNKQLEIFNKNYDIVVNGGPAPLDQNHLLEKANTCLGMLGEKDAWNKTFLESIVKQIQGNRPLSDKQITKLDQILNEKLSKKIKAETDAVMKPFRVSGKPKAKVQHDVQEMTRIQAVGVCKKCNREAELDFAGNHCLECDPMPF